jgi:hypothetical protein
MTNRELTKDGDIRSALHAQRLRRVKEHTDALVIDELGLAHAKSRIDVAVINGCIHGYEIKSAKDTLDRLSIQVDIYRQTLQKLTIVAASRHVARVLAHTPPWCGVIEAQQGSGGSIRFNAARTARMSPDIDPVMVAHLLWRTEVTDLLLRIGYAPKDLRRPRRQLYMMLCEAITLREITAAIHTFMVQRRAWRDRRAHV